MPRVSPGFGRPDPRPLPPGFPGCFSGLFLLAIWPMDPSEDVWSLPLCGCGKDQKCPLLSEKSDGSFALSDPDAGLGPIPLNREQAEDLVQKLGERLRVSRPA